MLGKIHRGGLIEKVFMFQLQKTTQPQKITLGKMISIIQPPTLLSPPQRLGCVALKLFQTSSVVVRLAPIEKSELRGPCAIRKFSFFICSKTRGNKVWIKFCFFLNMSLIIRVNITLDAVWFIGLLGIVLSDDELSTQPHTVFRMPINSGTFLQIIGCFIIFY